MYSQTAVPIQPKTNQILTKFTKIIYLQNFANGSGSKPRFHRHGREAREEDEDELPPVRGLHARRPGGRHRRAAAARDLGPARPHRDQGHAAMGNYLCFF